MLAGGSLAGEHDRGEDRDAAAYLAGSGAGAHCRRSLPALTAGASAGRWGWSTRCAGTCSPNARRSR